MAMDKPGTLQAFSRQSETIHRYMVMGNPIRRFEGLLKGLVTGCGMTDAEEEAGRVSGVCSGDYIWIASGSTAAFLCPLVSELMEV